MSNADLAGAEWRTSSYTDAGSCVEVAQAPAAVGVRDSKHPSPVLTFGAPAWAAFLVRVSAPAE
jgi:hypothetical protein